MKKILLIALTASLFSLNADAQNLVIKSKDGSSKDLDLENLRKITFSKGNMVATYTDKTYFEYAISTIGKLAFETGTGMNAIGIMDGHLAYSSQTGEAYVTGSKGSTLSVYNISGKVVLQKQISTDAESVDLSGLQDGFYLLKLNGITVKIRK